MMQQPTERCPQCGTDTNDRTRGHEVQMPLVWRTCSRGRTARSPLRLT
jgi:hypothetical protein